MTRFDPVPDVTIVVATYNRGAVLARSLRTVMAQSVARWQMLVIGDACTDDTAAQVAALGDNRMRFVNLPQRFGEQAGPNSVGAALAQTDYVAFLNHDDLWLPDHLAVALDALDNSDADLCWTRAAFFSNRGAWDDRAQFEACSAKGRRLEDLYVQPFVVAEPISAWVFRRAALERLGPMRRATDLPLFPIVDYCQRAHRLGLRLVTPDDITVLKDRVWTPGRLYDNPADYAEDWVRQIESGDITGLRRQIEQDLWLSDHLGLSQSPMGGHQSDRPLGRIDAQTGLNLTHLQAAAHRPSTALLDGLLTARTGDRIAAQPNLTQMIAAAREQLQ